MLICLQKLFKFLKKLTMLFIENMLWGELFFPGAVLIYSLCFHDLI